MERPAPWPWLGLIASVLLLGACDSRDEDERMRRVPTATVGVLAEPGAYTFDGQRMDLARLHEELRRLADQHRNERMGNSRVMVRIVTAPEADFARTTGLVDTCNGLGIDKIDARHR